MNTEPVGNNLITTPVDGERKKFDENDADCEFLDRISKDPGFRLQLSQLLTTYNISRYSADDLGYRSRPFVEMAHLINHLNLEQLEDDEKNVVAEAVLGTSIEVRDDLDTLFGRKTKRDRFSPQNSYASSLPFPLQVVVIAKACAGHEGSPLYPSDLSADSNERKELQEYVVRKFGHQEHKADLILDSIATIHGAAILTSHLKHGLESKDWRRLGKFPDSIVGEPAPRIGYYLPDNIETALRRVNVDLWRVDYLNADWRTSNKDIEEDKEFVDGVKWLSERVAELSGKPKSEQPFWRAYTFTSLLTTQAFMRHSVSGYSRLYDQLVSWKEPKPDAEFYDSYVKLNGQLKRYGEACGELAEEGVLMALKGEAIRIGHQVEQEIIYGSEESRARRLEVLAGICNRVARYDIGQAHELLASMPVISSHVYELSNRWQYPFS